MGTGGSLVGAATASGDTGEDESFLDFSPNLTRGQDVAVNLGAAAVLAASAWVGFRRVSGWRDGRAVDPPGPGPVRRQARRSLEFAHRAQGVRLPAGRKAPTGPVPAAGRRTARSSDRGRGDAR